MAHPTLAAFDFSSEGYEAGIPRVANIKVKKVVKGLSICKAFRQHKELVCFISQDAWRTNKAALKTQQKDTMTLETVFGNAFFCMEHHQL